MSQFLTLGANGKTMKFLIFVIRVYDEKLGHMLKPLMSKFRHDLSARLKDIAEKQVSAKPKPIGESGHVSDGRMVRASRKICVVLPSGVIQSHCT